MQFVRIATNSHLSRVAQTLGIRELLQNVAVASERAMWTRTPTFQVPTPSVGDEPLATGVEALIGAIFLDSGYDFHTTNRVTELMLSSTTVR